MQITRHQWVRSLRSNLLLATCLTLAACVGSNSGGNDDSKASLGPLDSPLDKYEQVTPVTLFDAEVVASQYPVEQVRRGKYLVELLACGTCHTDGALVGRPNDERLYGGSNVGIAYSNPLQVQSPAIVYPANITPDDLTGIGLWRDEDLVRLIRTGVDNHGRRQMPIMPWPGYGRLHSEDAYAIAAFLRSIKPVRHAVPVAVEENQPNLAPYVHFGVYRSRQVGDL
jgi:mono/diheme cytochrome c family protein